MSKGLTLAEFVQQVYYAIYKVRLDTSYQANSSENFQATTSKFQEVIMEANFVLQELQKEADWTWLRGKWDIGTACNPWRRRRCWLIDPGGCRRWPARRVAVLVRTPD